MSIHQVNLKYDNAFYRPDTRFVAVQPALSFGAKDSKKPAKTKFYRTTEQVIRFQEKLCRKFANFWASLFNRSMIDKYYQQFVKLDETSPDYIQSIAEVGRFWSQKKEFEVNTESNRLKDIVNSDEACIFIMNHDHQAQDPVLLGCMANLLYTEYLAADKASTCPRPKVILNEDILSTQPPKMRAIFEKFGAVGVDASLIATKDGDKRNTKNLLPVLKGFCRDKNHVFIFPEGKMSAFNDLQLEDRFQSGIGDLIKIAARTKKRVKVVPLGFDYNSKAGEFLGSIYIGKPVYFINNGQNLMASYGNIRPLDWSSKCSDFFYRHNTSNPPVEIDDVKYKPLTDNGQPVTDNRLKRFVSGVLVDNLSICKKLARKQLPQKPLGDELVRWA